MTSLYLIADEYRDAAGKLADLDLPPEVIADTLESLSGALEAKAQSVAHMVRHLEASAAACKQWAKDATDRAKTIESRADSLRAYLAATMERCDLEKIEGPGIKIGWRKSSAVIINEPGLIPAEFMRQPEPPPKEPDKVLIKAALTGGQEVPGAHIEHKRTLQIK